MISGSKIGWRIFSRILFAVGGFLIVKPVVAQRNMDAALWENIYLEKKISSDWNLHFNEEGRINQNVTRLYFVYGDLGLTYKWNKHFHLSGDYVIEAKRQLDEGISLRHQLYLALVLKEKAGNFTFYNRFMPQVEWSDIYSSRSGWVPDYYYRDKVTIKFNNISRYTFYVASEIYYKINMPWGDQTDRLRSFVGMFYELNRTNEVEFYYLYEKHFNVNDPLTNFIYGIGFAHTFY